MDFYTMNKDTVIKIILFTAESIPCSIPSHVPYMFCSMLINMIRISEPTLRLRNTYQPKHSLHKLHNMHVPVGRFTYIEHIII